MRIHAPAAPQACRRHIRRFPTPTAQRPDTTLAAELGEARSKLASADTAVSQQKMTVAEQYADESRIEAQLASAKTADAKAKAVNDETTRNTGT